MSSFNKVILMGRLVSDPEVKNLQNGSVAKLTLAVDDSYVDKDNNKVERVDFIDCDAFSPRSDIIAKFFKKGDPILIEGKLRQEKWQDSNGQNRTKIGVRVESFEFVNGRKTEQSSQKPVQSNNNSGGNVRNREKAPF